MTTPAAPSRTDWLILAGLAILWGGSFALIKTAVATAPPALVTMGRLWVGTACLLFVLARTGQALPRLLPRPDPLWGWFAALGFFGSALPFFLISLGQTRVPSALAGILMAVMPIATVALALAAVPGETLSLRRAAGLALGFAGVVVLIGPSALADMGGPAVWAQAAILTAAMAYALNAVLARRAPDAAPLVMGAGLITTSAVITTPFGVAAALSLAEPPSAASLAAIAALGVGATGLGAVLYMRLIRSAGPSFLALVNYVVPLVAAGIGWLLGETIAASALLALAMIIAGVALAGRRR